MTLTPSKYQVDWLLKQIGTGDRFVSQDAQTGTQYGYYRVDGGILTATGYNDYLSRMTTRITDASWTQPDELGGQVQGDQPVPNPSGPQAPAYWMARYLHQAPPIRARLRSP